MLRSIVQFTAIFLLVSVCYSQTPRPTINEAARPAVGWDSLKNMIIYPEIAQRAGIQGYANVAVELTESGTMESVSVSGYGIFSSNIEQIVKKLKWMPEVQNGKPVRSTVVFELQFQLRSIQDMPKKRVLIIESDLPVDTNKR
jgi:TonB family protein